LKITILYFAAVRDLVATAEERVETDAKTIAELRVWLEANRPALSGRLGSVRLARNEQFATDADAIADGDVVALIPPVAGG
jgi:molybdopterin converting factor subunit 1